MESKNIKSLLNEHLITVPEIQREYVWGNNKKVLLQFLEDLNKDIQKNSNVGFLYSYEPGHSDKEIYLIDGQQRFTTLLLLIFYLALKEKKKHEFEELLKLQEPTPAFSYRVRSFTETFLSSIWKEINDIEEFEKIKNQTWYFSAYDNDITIQAICSALKTIYEFAKEQKEHFHLTYEHCIQNIFFWYFEVKHTSQGEELYITMNSRGQQLTEAEQIKPLLFNKAKKEGECPKDGNVSWGKTWDNWEEFFFSLKEEEQSIGDVGAAMNQFIKIVIELCTCTEHNEIKPIKDVAHITLRDLETYFIALKELKEKNSWEKKDRKLFDEEIERLMGRKTEFSDERFLILKSLLTAQRFKSQRDCLRLFRITRNLCRRRVVNHTPLLAFLKRLRESEMGLYDFIKENRPEHVFDAHELAKISIYSASQDNQIEEMFWDIEEHEYLKGNIECIWHEKFTDIDDKKAAWQEHDKIVMEKRIRIFKEIFSPQHTHSTLSKAPKIGEIDNAFIARTLLALSDDRCTYHTGGNNWCYGFRTFWDKIISQSSKYISDLIGRLSKDENITYYDYMQKIIEERHYPSTDGRYYVLKYADSLQSPGNENGYNILRFGNWTWDNYDISILTKERASSYNVNLFEFLVYKQLKNKNIIKSEWDFQMNNGLRIECSKEEFGWIVSYESNSSAEELEKYQKGINDTLGENAAEYDNSEKIIRIPVNPEKDLIEEGIRIINCLYSIIVL